MRQLRLVTTADDGSHLVLAPDGSPNERFVLPVDEPLRDAVHDCGDGPDTTHVRGQSDGAQRHSSGGERPGFGRPSRGSTGGSATGDAPVGPREIQMRVRAGEDPQAIAEAYDMPLERVMRFAAAVVEERLRIADEARRARARRSPADSKVVVFGEAVDARFAAYGINLATVTWDSRRRPDGEWLVVAAWNGEDTTHEAQWLFHRTSRSVTAIDAAAADLLSDRPIRPAMPPEPARPSLVSTPPPGSVVTFPPMPDADTGPLPRVEDVFDQDAPPEGPRDVPLLVPAARLTSTSATAAAPTAPLNPAPLNPAPRPIQPQPASDVDAPPLPLRITDPATRPSVASADAVRFGGGPRRRSDDSRPTRTSVPSWDDILLGVRRQSD